MSVEKAQLASFLDSSACSARVCSNKNRYTTRWLSTSTFCRPLSSQAVSLAVRLHDGLLPASDFPTHCWLGKDSVFNADPTVNPWHCLSCPALKCRSIYRRHNAVVDLLLRLLAPARVWLMLSRKTSVTASLTAWCTLATVPSTLTSLA